MSELKKLNPKTTAVLPMDCQKGIVDFIAAAEKIFPAAAKVLEAARGKQVPVIHVGIGFRPGYPEVSPLNASFSGLKASGRFVLGTDSAQFHPMVAPKEGELTITKQRVSAFSHNDLAMILRAQGITDLVLFGIATSGIVLSTLRQAADLDFRCVVIEDCCFDPDEEVHRVLTQKVFTRQATVVNSATFIKEML